MYVSIIIFYLHINEVDYGSVCQCVCVSVCTHVHLCVYVCPCIHLCVHICVLVCTHVRAVLKIRLEVGQSFVGSMTIGNLMYSKFVLPNWVLFGHIHQKMTFDRPLF